MSILRALIQRLKKLPLGAAGLAAHRLMRAVRRYQDFRAERDFDRKHSVDTRSPGADSVDPGPRHPYDPTRESTFREALARVQAPLDQFAFVDIGSGKGRVLLMASSYPFKRLIGVEFDRALHEAAVANLRGRPNVELFCQDALDLELPDRKIFYFMFNPFGEELMSRFAGALSRWLSQGGREAVIVYVNPRFTRALDAIEGLTLVARADGDAYSGYRVYRSKPC